MKLRSILLVPRRKGRFQLDEAETYWGEPPAFHAEEVEAVRPGEGVGVLLVFRLS